VLARLQSQSLPCTQSESSLGAHAIDPSLGA
jgi:hypothetical protein